jgi:hypothetical protein
MTELNELLILAQSELPDYLVKDFGQYPRKGGDNFCWKESEKKNKQKEVGATEE